MIYPGIPLNRWLNKYPALHDNETLCECQSPNPVAVKTNKSVGVVCKECNTATWIRTTWAGNQKALELIYNYF